MSAYKGHRGPNVSQYIANLNQLSPPEGQLEEPVAAEEDFALFLNNDFFDVNGPIPNFDAPLDLDVDVTAEQTTTPNLGPNSQSRKHSIPTSADPSMEFNLNGKSPLPLFLPCACVLLLSVWPAMIVYCLQLVVQ